MAAKITKRTVDAAKPGDRDRFLWDTDPKGFGLKVTPAGNKVYVLQYRMGGRESPARRFTIGKHGSPWTPDTAREEARRLLAEVGKGIDPMAAKRQKRADAVNLEFERYAELFIDRYAKANQTRSWTEAKRVLDHDLIPAFKGRTIADLTRRDIAHTLEEIDRRAPAVARFAHATLRKLFRWAVGREDIAASPMTDMPSFKPLASRDRVLSDVELRAVWLACEKLDHPFGPFVRLLIATGQRLGEVAEMDFAELDFDGAVWTIPAARAKNGLAHTVPLNSAALGVLEALGAAKRKRGLVFTTTGETPISGFSKAKKRLDRLALDILRQDALTQGGKADDVHLAPWRYHDLRRTLATGLQRLGTRLEVTEAVLNHISGSRAGIVGVYQRHNWADEKRMALTAWDAHLSAIIDGKGKGANVIALADRRA
jgi:integrase